MVTIKIEISSKITKSAVAFFQDPGTGGVGILLVLRPQISPSELFHEVNHIKQLISQIESGKPLTLQIAKKMEEDVDYA